MLLFFSVRQQQHILTLEQWGKKNLIAFRFINFFLLEDVILLVFHHLYMFLMLKFWEGAHPVGSVLYDLMNLLCSLMSRCFIDGSLTYCTVSIFSSLLIFIFSFSASLPMRRKPFCWLILLLHSGSHRLCLYICTFNFACFFGIVFFILFFLICGFCIVWLHCSSFAGGGVAYSVFSLLLFLSQIQLYDHFTHSLTLFRNYIFNLFYHRIQQINVFNFSGPFFSQQIDLLCPWCFI